MNPDLKRYMLDIAKIYGVKVKFENRSGGIFRGDEIAVGVNRETQKEIIKTFCHELAHFVLWKTGKYKKFHDPKYFGNLHSQFKHYGHLVRYALNAEIATEKLGKQLCKEWFPKVKYEPYYKNTKLCYEFLYGYYFRG